MLEVIDVFSTPCNSFPTRQDHSLEHTAGASATTSMCYFWRICSRLHPSSCSRCDRLQGQGKAGHDGAEQADALALDLIDHLVDQIQERNRSKKPSKKKCKDLIKELENFLNGGNSTSVQARQCYKLRTTYRCPWMLLMRSVRQSSGSPLFDSTGCHTQPAPHPLTVAREPGDARTT